MMRVLLLALAFGHAAASGACPNPLLAGALALFGERKGPCCSDHSNMTKKQGSLGRTTKRGQQQKGGARNAKHRDARDRAVAAAAAPAAQDSLVVQPEPLPPVNMDLEQSAPAGAPHAEAYAPAGAPLTEADAPASAPASELSLDPAAAAELRRKQLNAAAQRRHREKRRLACADEAQAALSERRTLVVGMLRDAEPANSTGTPANSRTREREPRGLRGHALRRT
jgi:hypothetical protein